MSSTKRNLFTILCFMSVSSCFGWQLLEDVVQLFEEKHYQGQTTTLQHLWHWEDPIWYSHECRSIPYYLYEKVSSLIMRSRTIAVEFYKEDNCQGLVLKTSSEQSIPDLEKKHADDVFKSYRLYHPNKH